MGVFDEYDNQVYEANDLVRGQGRHQSSLGINTVAKLMCWKKSEAFPLSTQDSPPGTRAEMQSLAEFTETVLSSECECSQFAKWLPGRTPKEHEEMSFVEMIDARTRQWRDEDIRSKQQFEALYEVRHQETRRDLEKAHRTATIIGIVSIIGSILAAIIASYLTAYFATR
ncbi:hypothetical protein [Aeoliella sp. SH292]|uniref:hypothetical protein n=1 Tax=Aeoliella sp. SH292 TaxID=3454464 RepID=UPI003F9CCD58